MRIIKKEDNTAVMREVVINKMNLYMRRVVKKMIGFDRKKWELEKLFLMDIEKYAQDFSKKHSNDAVLTLRKLKSYTSNWPRKKENKLSKIEKREELKFKNFDLKHLDTAGIVKVLRHRRPDGFDVFYTCVEETLNKIYEFRNKYEGHLDEVVKEQCTTKILIKEIGDLLETIKSSVENLENALKGTKEDTNEYLLMKYSFQVMIEAQNYLSEVKETIEDISNSSIIKDSSMKYTAENLLSYKIFIVYPDVKSDKFRRFCNDSLRMYHALKGAQIYTDIGTISALEAYSLSRDSERKNEAKQIQKTLLEPMLRGQTLQVIDFREEKESKDECDFIDTNCALDEELFLEKIQQISGKICVITDDIDIADGVWKLKANKGIEGFSAVAVKVVDKETVVPYYK